jgi:hypothetical protein
MPILEPTERDPAEVVLVDTMVALIQAYMPG